MNISILCSSRLHPVYQYLESWVNGYRSKHNIDLVQKVSELNKGDLLFLVSCTEIIRDDDRDKFSKVLVLHASDLPTGRGWSPHIWEIISGVSEITVTLLEADSKVDSGKIWHKVKCDIPKHALWYEINQIIFKTELALIEFAINNLEKIEPYQQDSKIEPTYYRKRTPQDSRIDIDKSIKEQFDLLRVCDPERFPAFFEYHGYRYNIKLEKVVE